MHLKPHRCLLEYALENRSISGNVANAELWTTGTRPSGHLRSCRKLGFLLCHEIPVKIRLESSPTSWGRNSGFPRLSQTFRCWWGVVWPPPPFPLRQSCSLEPVWLPTFGPFYSHPTCCCLFPEPISRQPWFCAVCRQSRSLPSPADIGYRGGISRNFPEICNSTSLITFWLEVSTDAFMELSFWEPILVDVPRLGSVLGDF